MRALLAPIFVLLVLAVPGALAQEPAPVEVEIGVFALSFGNYDVNKGTYTMDFYLFFRWDPAKAPAGFTPGGWELMNGDASGAKTPKIYDAIDNETGEREVWYRVKATLLSAPRFDRFPYDTQRVSITVEDSVYTRDELVYVAMVDESGLDDEFVAGGWQVGEPHLEVVDKSYKFGEDYSRAKFDVELSRAKLSTTIKTLLPPVAFVLVAGLAFFFHPTKWGNRVGLGTGMLISAVMFHISQTLALPPLPRLVLFDKVMIAVYLFILASLAVTALIAIDEDYWKDRDYTKQINSWGALLAVAIPAIALGALLLL